MRTDATEARRYLTFPAASWVTLLLLLLLGWTPGASPALRVDAVEYVTSVMIHVAELSHHVETLRLRFEDTQVARVECPVDQILTRLHSSVVHNANRERLNSRWLCVMF